MYTIKDIFDLNHTIAGDYLLSFVYPWEALDGIEALILSLGPSLGEDYKEVMKGVWVHRSAVIAPSASISGPCIIGEGTEVRHCAFIRGSVLAGKNCVIGNSTEVKNSILFDRVEIPHFNYVGDSILGYCSHMGAGAITSNIRSDRKNIVIHDGGKDYETLRLKVGAMLGDHVEVGCSAVLNPGTIIGRNSRVYPLTLVRGVVPGNFILRNDGELRDILY
ncbi:MAG: hypothetical protein K5634_05935 [Sphaerochaetaceae bacterium]|nr:hypothetical protein [Sphaerochaetaceae bacterium]